MSERLRNTVTVGAIVVMVLLALFLVVSSPSEADRVASIGDRIKCPVCQGESIGNSPSQMARDMMVLVEDRVSGGATDTQIIDELLSSYSGALLLDPPASGNTLFLWIAPALALVGGGAVIVWWRRHPGLAGSTAESSDTNKKRPLVGGLILVGAFAVAVIVAGYYIQDRDGPAVGVADQSIENLEDVSNETMEAVVAANLEHPRVNGMRLALAERYFEISDYRSAFPHYLAVAESALAKPDEAVTALVRLGWMAWEGNGEVEAALGLLDQALVIEPNATGALFLKARVLWCGSNDPISAKAILDDILAQPDLSSDSRQAVESELKTLATGLGCE